MVSFSCEACGDVLTKKSLDKHRNQCRGASFTCLDCMVHFHGTEYRSHTACISEAQKYQGQFYKEKEKKGSQRRSMNNGYDNSQAMVPRRAYVEDAPDGDDSQVIAVVDVPPRAPTPPTAAEPVGELPENVNVFDFLVETPNGNQAAIGAPDERRMLEHAQYHGNGGPHYPQYHTRVVEPSHHGFSYGHAPVEPSFQRYDSWHNLNDPQQANALMPPPPYVTPGPKEHRKEKKDKHTSEKSDKKRKRHAVEELDLASVKRRDEVMPDAPVTGGRVLHSGLTGGLNKLVTDPDFYEDRIDAGPTPILSPIKRSKRTGEADEAKKSERRKSSYVSHSTTTSSKPASSSKHAAAAPEDKHHHRAERKYHDDKHERKYHDDKQHQRRRNHRESTSSDDRPNRKHFKAIEYAPEVRPASVQPNATNQLVSYTTRADLFMSFINKGPDSERGLSINKILKRYHRERDVRGGDEKEDEDKELWKSLRLRRNDRGEIVLFI
ncbi:hypothetical protein LTR37_016403 [Vermiconidia calcicola]|uniref:Uncharacterized protein n=1 Tax=Vermiconidia calcicola TaxID=1690605 RepID=A0ACC3MNM2_9PEZI|nr:hypothetical protein LTR37_016403 [Vermiconidia calcicola]